MVVRVEPHDGISDFMTVTQRAACFSFYHVKTQQKRQSFIAQEVLHLDLEFPSLQNYEKQISIVCKPPSLWYSVIAAPKD